MIRKQECLTFYSESIILDTISHVPPDHILYILQGLRGQWCVEARSLYTHMHNKRGDSESYSLNQISSS